MSGLNYTVVAHAPVPGQKPDLVWVAIARWDDQARGTSEWSLELWDAQGEAGDDIEVEDEAAAKATALERFHVPIDSWIVGPQPFGTEPA